MNIISDSEEKKLMLPVPHRKKKTKQKNAITSHAIMPKNDTEIYLEKLLFGGTNDVLENLNKASAEVEASKNICTSPVSRRKRKTQGVTSVKKRKPAWEDEDDISRNQLPIRSSFVSNDGFSKKKSYCEELQHRFESIVGTPSWANFNKSKAILESDDEILQRVGDFVVKPSMLPSGTIDVKQCRNLAMDHYNLGYLTSIEFHPTAQVALLAGSKRKAALYQVDGLKNPEIQKVVFEQFSISCAHFSTTGEEFIVASPHHRFFYAYDMLAGKSSKICWSKGIEDVNMKQFYVSPDGKFIIVPGITGFIHILAAKTKEWLHSVKMNSNVQGIAFSDDGHQMYSHSENGEVYLWDMYTRDCIHKFYDDGCVKGTSIALSSNGQYLACGSNTGTVNIYDTNAVHSSNSPRPVKTILNLTTSAAQLKFNCSSEILAMSSSVKGNALKLIHFPSMTAFSNFPSFGWKLDNITTFDISLNSGFLATGTSKGTSHLFRLNHYGSF